MHETPQTRMERLLERRRRRRGWEVAATLAVVALIGALGALFLLNHPEAASGAQTGTYVEPSSSSSSSFSGTMTGNLESGKKKPVRDAEKESKTSEDSSRKIAPKGDPVRVEVISSEGRSLVDTRLNPTKLAEDGSLAPPFGVGGWYDEPGWPKPGDFGAGILVGHIDHRGAPDVFWNLPQSRAGDKVIVHWGNGGTATYTVTRSQSMGKGEVPKDSDIWRKSADKKLLRLITCDPQTPLSGGHYQGNWVVWAEK